MGVTRSPVLHNKGSNKSSVHSFSVLCGALPSRRLQSNQVPLVVDSPCLVPAINSSHRALCLCDHQAEMTEGGHEMDSPLTGSL
jgi:hypothetical protein